MLEMGSLQSSQPKFLRIVPLVYILIATTRVAIVKQSVCVTISQKALEGGSTKLEVKPDGAGITDRLPLSHHGTSCLSSRSIKSMLAARVCDRYRV